MKETATVLLSGDSLYTNRFMSAVLALLLCAVFVFVVSRSCVVQDGLVTQNVTKDDFQTSELVSTS